MTLVRCGNRNHGHYGDVASLMDQFNQLLEGGVSRRETGSDHSPASWYPPTDIYEATDEYVFRLEVPGLSKDDVTIEMEKNALTVKGERKQADDFNEENYHRLESFSGNFSRRFNLPKDVDSTKMEARLKDGVLIVRVAKAPEMVGREIPISVN